MEQKRVPGPTGEVRTEPPKPAAPEDLPRPTPKSSRPKVPHWIIQIRQLDLAEVAEELGLQIEGARLRPCPRCGDETRAEVYQNKQGWTLWRCGACETRDRGNLDLASYALTGQKAGELEPESKSLLRQWFADQGWCDGEDVEQE